MTSAELAKVVDQQTDISAMIASNSMEVALGADSICGHIADTSAIIQNYNDLSGQILSAARELSKDGSRLAAETRDFLHAIKTNDNRDVESSA